MGMKNNIKYDDEMFLLFHRLNYNIRRSSRSGRILLFFDVIFTRRDYEMRINLLLP